MNFSGVIKDQRRELGLTQEQLAERMGISVQAVSKWECGLSYPDIESLPTLAGIFGVSIDYLLTGSMAISQVVISDAKETVTIVPEGAPVGDWPDDGVLRVVQYLGRVRLSQETYNPKVAIKLEIPEGRGETHVEIWGSAEIDGDINGNAAAGNSLSCRTVNGDAAAGGSVSCGNVSGDAHAGGSVSCGNVDGDAHAGGSVNCGNVDGDARAGGGVNCGNVEGDVEAGGALNCGDIEGDVREAGEVRCGNIEGSILHCTGDVHCESIEGDIHCNGELIRGE